MTEPRLHVIDGVRTAFARAGTELASHHAEDLATLAVRELMLRTGVDPARIDQLVCGNVGQNARAANIGRVVALRAGLPQAVPAYTVHRNCASGLETVTQCELLLRTGRGSLFLAVGTESMSNYALNYTEAAVAFFSRLQRARTLGQRGKALLRWRPSMFRPRVALLDGLVDPVVGLGMGQTAELLAREWGIDRETQDAFALRSQRRALAGRERLREETFDVATGRAILRDDNGVREDSSMEKLARLRTVFDRSRYGTVTAGNSSQITDGAVALLVGSADAARDLGLEPLGHVESWTYAGCDPARMGLGPLYATSRLRPETAHPFEDLDLIELNEAFAAQVIACQRAARETAFCRDKLGREHALGEIPDEILNVNGGAIALGHPVGATGARMVLTVLKELRRRGGRRALATLCVGGGQGGALILNSETI